MSINDLRAEVLELCDVLQAIVAFNYQLTPEIRHDLDRIRESVAPATSKILRYHRSELSIQIKTTSASFGLIPNPKKFAKWFKSNYRSGLGILQLPKWIIDKQYFANFGGSSKGSKRYPHHAMIAVDFEGRFKPLHPEYYLAEAVLYEDMCGAYNLAVESERAIKVTNVVKLSAKQHYLFSRTAVLSAYYFVEAYLNGLAFDFYVENNKKISQEDIDLLTEWNSALKKPALKNFRTKALQYPRIVLGTKHPPLTETNSSNLSILFKDGKEFRDSIVHQNPKPVEDTIPKLTALVHLRLADVTRIVDAAVGFVSELNPLLGQYSMQLNWLFPRDSSGIFPQESFD